MNKIKVGKRYTYKGNVYEVVNFGRLKNPTTYDWVDAVIYKKAIYDERELEDVVYTRKLEDFKEKFMPRNLQIGDNVLAISMGKQIAIYTVISIENGRVKYSGAQDKCSFETTDIVGFDGRVGVLTPDPYVKHINCLEYYLVTNNFKRNLENKSCIEKIRSLLMNTVEEFGKIDITLPQSKTIQDCLKEVDIFTNSMSKTINLWLPSKKQ